MKRLVVRPAEGGEDSSLLARDLFNSYAKMMGRLG